MRGKLRDKHAKSKHDVFKREVLDRKRPGKQSANQALWLNPDLDEQDDEFFEDEGEQEVVANAPIQEAKPEIPVQKQQPVK